MPTGAHSAGHALIPRGPSVSSWALELHGGGAAQPTLAQLERAPDLTAGGGELLTWGRTRQSHADVTRLEELTPGPWAVAQGPPGRGVPGAAPGGLSPQVGQVAPQRDATWLAVGTEERGGVPEAGACTHLARVRRRERGPDVGWGGCRERPAAGRTVLLGQLAGDRETGDGPSAARSSSSYGFLHLKRHCRPSSRDTLDAGLETEARWGPQSVFRSPC